MVERTADSLASTLPQRAHSMKLGKGSLARTWGVTRKYSAPASQDLKECRAMEMPSVAQDRKSSSRRIPARSRADVRYWLTTAGGKLVSSCS